MPLMLSAHRPEVAALAATRLRGLAQPELASAVLGREAAPSAVTLAAPHVGYAIGIERLRVGAGLEAATPFALRYLLLDRGEAVGSVDVGPADGSEPLTVSRIGAGRHDAALLAALCWARDAAAGVDAEIEPRFLLLPALYVAALWLHGPRERIVPLLSEGKDLVDGRTYEQAEIEPILRRLAGTRSSPPHQES